MATTTTWQRSYLAVVGLLERRRRQLDLTQHQLGERIGLSRHAISRYERGIGEMSAVTLFRWAEAVGVTLAADLRHDGKPPTAAAFDDGQA